MTLARTKRSRFNDPITETLTFSNISDSIYAQEDTTAPYSNPGYGDFSDALESDICHSGGGCGDQIVSFSVSRAGGFTNVNQLVSSNGTAYFAADVFANGGTGAIAVTGVGITSGP